MHKLKREYKYIIFAICFIFVLSIFFINSDNIKGDSWSYGYIGRTQTFVAPTTGNYVLEVWGAQGGHSTYGGKGGYSKGTIHLTKGQTLYINVGQQPTNIYGGWNGGSTAATDSGHGTYYGGVEQLIYHYKERKIPLIITQQTISILELL